MVELFVGKKGKGKTKYLLDDVSEAVKSANGNIVFIDKDSERMHGLNQRVRLINVSDYGLEDDSEFLGFISGIISQDYDLEILYVDSLLKVAHIDAGNIEKTIKKLDAISKKRNIRFVLSVSADKNDIPSSCYEYIKIDL